MSNNRHNNQNPTLFDMLHIVSDQVQQRLYFKKTSLNVIKPGSLVVLHKQPVVNTAVIGKVHQNRNVIMSEYIASTVDIMPNSINNLPQMTTTIIPFMSDYDLVNGIENSQMVGIVKDIENKGDGINKARILIPSITIDDAPMLIWFDYDDLHEVEISLVTLANSDLSADVVKRSIITDNVVYDETSEIYHMAVNKGFTHLQGVSAEDIARDKEVNANNTKIMLEQMGYESENSQDDTSENNKDAFDAYNTLMGNIRDEVTPTLLKVTEPAQEQIEKNEYDYDDHVMIDMETVSTEPDAGILEIGLVRFTPRTGQIHEKLEIRFDVKEVIESGADISYSTLVEFWLEKMPHHVMQRVIVDKSDRVPIAYGIKLIRSFMSTRRNMKIWGKGPSFDVSKLAAMIKRHDFENQTLPWQYYNERCVRTVQAFAPNVAKNVTFVGDKHVAIYDAMHQVAQVSAVIKYKNL